MLKLPVASLSAEMAPPILFEKPDHFADLHVTLPLVPHNLARVACAVRTVTYFFTDRLDIRFAGV